MDSLFEMWSVVCEELKQSLGDVIFNVWLKPVEIKSFDGSVVVLSVVDFIRKTLEKNFMEDIRNAFKTQLGLDVEIAFVDPETVEEPVQPAEMSKSQITVPASTVENNTFETFVVGSSNRFAYTAAKAVAESPTVAYNPLYIYGSSGLGKTHLLCAIKNSIAERKPDAKIVFTRGEDFVNLIVEGIRNKNMNSIHEKFRNCDVLLVDDIQFIAGKASTQEEFFHTFNALTAAGKQIVLISDNTPKNIDVLDERLRTRFEQGLIADIQPPDFETRVAIIRKKAETLNLDIPEEVTEYIAEKVKINIRQLEGAVKKMHALVNLEGSVINIAMAQSVLKDLASEGLPVTELVNKIIAETARTFAVPSVDITSKKKEAKIVKARQIAIYTIRKCSDLTQQEISEFFGIDRTAVLYAIRKIEPVIERDPSLTKTVENIIKNVKEQ